MPEVELKDEKILESGKAKTLDDRLNELLSGDYNENQNFLNKDDILELIFKEHTLIDKLKNNPSDSSDILKEFFSNYDEIIRYVENNSDESPDLQELLHFLNLEKDKLLQLISSENNNLVVLDELTNVLCKMETFYNRFLIDDNIFTDVESFSIPKIDELYKKLYDAISQNDSKKITLYRGRIIRALKHHKKEIDEKYEEVKCLDEINELIEQNDFVSMEQIKNVLNKKENLLYQYYFSYYVQNLDTFKEKFYEIYKRKQVKKKTLYKNALKKELKEHGRVLDERYANEFLDKKGTLPSIVTVLPKAVGLSIKKVVNNINMLREATTNRRKVKESLDTLKSMGRVIYTPFIYAGKFVTSNWYALYLLLNGYADAKQAKAQAEAEEKARIEENARIQAEEEAKAQAEAEAQTEARAQMEAEGKARAEAEAKARAEEARIRGEQTGSYDEARIQAESAAHERIEAARAQAEAEARAQAEAKAQAEAIERQEELLEEVEEIGDAIIEGLGKIKIPTSDFDPPPLYDPEMWNDYIWVIM